MRKCRERGERNSVTIGMRSGNFRNTGTHSNTALYNELTTNDYRCFEVAVIITDSEEERKSLEEYIFVSLNLPPFTPTFFYMTCLQFSTT